MSLFTILETLLIGPLKLLFEFIFSFSGRFIDSPGLQIIVLSLLMNILVLPLYKRADAMQEESRLVEEKLGAGVAHIKKTFSGDEKMMILQTYYRQNNYKPTNALKGSVSLLLEIPFFMAAYQFLSNLGALQGASLGPIADLSAPDGLLVIGGFAINVLPVLMTLVNVVSAALYLKGFPLKTKIQLYAMALFFLVFLYTSPSGLVFYWTLNNVFSLVKNIFYKLKNPGKVLRILTAVLGIGCIVGGLAVFGFTHYKRLALTCCLGILLLLPAVQYLLKAKLQSKKQEKQIKTNKKMFVLGTVFLTILIGVLIPATYIAASPLEYIDATYFHHPLWYVASCTAMAAGFFLVWLRVFYWLANEKWKVIFERLVWVLCGVTLVNYMFFGTNLGTVSATLKYEIDVAFSTGEQLLNTGVLVVLTAVLLFVAVKFKKVVVPVLLTATIAIGAMSGINMITVASAVGQLQLPASGTMADLELSKNGKNVVVIMLDRAMGQYVPYLMNEKPELQEKFDGFTYYSNVISFGGFTNFGTPALFGGYEYTPVELNRRADELLEDKHNEALLVMPALFTEKGYDVTVCDPPYAGYQWIPDLSIYNDYPELEAYITKGMYSDVGHKQSAIRNNYRNFFCHSLMKVLPVVLQPELYEGGNYNQKLAIAVGAPNTTVQTVTTTATATGTDSLFTDTYRVLENLSNMTTITEHETGAFLLMANETTHEPILMQTPDYTPAETVDNTAYDAQNQDRFTVNGQTLDVSATIQMGHYHANMAAFIQLGEWFDYLRENGVYDNTRIILVADHGKDLHQLSQLEMGEEGSYLTNVELFFPLLMVKDFDAKGFTTDDTFMTNADVPTLATQGVIEAPVNPFTGKQINDSEKWAHPQYIIRSEIWDINQNDETFFMPCYWASVTENIWDKANWTFFDYEVALMDHSYPAAPQ